MKATPITVGLALLVLFGPWGCGGGASSSGNGGTGMNEIMWPSRDGSPSSTLPPSVTIGRIIFQPQSGEACCVAVDPALLSGSAERGLAVLTNLPVGPATVTVAGFATGFAPAVPGIAATCDTVVPPGAASACDDTQVASPAFESPPLAVTILAGVQTNLGAVPMEAMPFVLDGFIPAQGTNAAAPVQFALTVVDGATNVRRDSVELEVIFTLPTETAPVGTTPSPFRTLSKRVPLNLEACADGTAAPCSPTGSLQLAGFAATGTAPELPEGPVEAHVTAENLGDPPQQLDFRYPFNVLATPTETATATPTTAETASASSAGVPAGDGAGVSSSGGAGAPAGGPREARPSTVDGAPGLPSEGQPAPLPSDTPSRPMLTPTATPTPGNAR